MFISECEPVNFSINAEKFCRMNLIFYLPLLKWWTRGDLSRTGHWQMPRNSNGPGPQKKDQHSLERPKDLLPSGTQGKKSFYLRVCLSRSPFATLPVCRVMGGRVGAVVIWQWSFSISHEQGSITIFYPLFTYIIMTRTY